MRKLLLGVTAFLLAGCSADLPHDSPYDPETPLAKQAPGQVHGRVTLEHEADYSQVTVKLTGGIVDYDTQTDPAGEFAFSRVLPGTYALSAFSRYFEAATREVTVGIDGSVDAGAINLRVQRARVSGAARAEQLQNRTVVVEGGVSLLLTRVRSLRSAAASPMAYAPLAVSAPEVTLSTISSPDGSWQLTDVPLGAYELTASHAGTPSELVDEIVVGETGDVRVDDVLLKPLTGFFDIVGSDGSPLYTRSQTVTLKLLGFNAQRMRLGLDAGSGCAYTRDEEYAAQVSFDLAAVEGQQAVCARFVSADGAETADLRGSILLDMAAPTLIQARIFSNGGFVTSASAILELAAADAGAGLAWVQWTDTAAGVTAAAKQPWSPSLLAALPNPGVPGTKTLYLRVLDAAGNATPVQAVSALLDLSVPVLASVDVRALDGSPFTVTNQTVVRVLVSASDADGSPLEMELSGRSDFLGAVWQTYAPAIDYVLAPGYAQGAQTVYARVRDAAGRVGVAASAGFQLDTVPPAAPAVAFAAAVTNGATARLSIAGAGYAFAEVDDSLAFDAPVATAAAFYDAPLGTGDGPRTFYVRLVDAVGNRGPAGAASIDVDRTPPSNASVAIVQASPTNAASLTFNLFANAAVEYRLQEGASCGGAWVPYASQAVLPVSAGDGVKDYAGQFRDAAGNASACQVVSIDIDRAEPDVLAAPLINGGAPATRLPVVTIATAVTGAVEAQVSEDAGFAGATWQPAAATYAWALSAGDGPKTVYLRWRDAAGNTTVAHSADIALDTTAPDQATLVPVGASTVSSTGVSFTVTAGGSPAAMQLANDASFAGAAELPFASPVTWTLTAGDGLKSVYVRVRDEVGNWSSPVGATLVLDTIAPTVLQARIANTGGYVLNAAAVLDLAATDAGSGVAWVQWASSAGAVTAAAQTAYASTVAIGLPAPTTPGLKTLYLRLVDAAGNATSIIPVSATLDLSVPVISSVGLFTLEGVPVSLTNQTRLRIDLAASDADGAPLEMSLSNRADFLGAAWQPLAPTVYWDVAPAVASGGESRTVYVRLRDAAGRTATPSSATFTLDTVAPSSPTAAFALALTSGVTARLNFSGSNWTFAEVDDNFAFDSPATTTATAIDVPLGSGEGQRTFYVRLADDAGNRSGAVAASIEVDRTPPVNATFTLVQSSPSNAVSLTFLLSALGATEYRLQEGTSCGGTWFAYTTQAVLPMSAGDGVKNYRAQFRDTAGNTTACLSTSITADHAMPVVSAAPVINGGALRTRSQVVTVAATVTGAVEAQISEDGGFAGAPWQPTAPTFTWLLSPGDGTKTLYLRWRDAAGNNTGTHTATIDLDTTAPDAVSIAPAATLVTTTTVTFTISANGSPAFMQLANDPSFAGASEVAYATSKAWPLTTGDGLKTVYVRVRDAAGNWSLPSGVSLTLDTQAPVPLGFTLNGGALLTNSTGVAAALAASGADEMRLSGDISGGATAWLAAQNNVALTLASTDGVKVVTARWRDAAGNYSVPVTAFISLDATKPGNGSVVIGGLDPTNSPTVSLTITSSGATQMMIGNDSGFTGGQWEAVSSPRTWNLSAFDGSKTVFVKFRDAAGNESATPAQDAVVLDTAPPSGASFAVVGGSPVPSTTLTLSLFASGAAQVMTGNDPVFTGGVWRTYAASVTHVIPSGDGLKAVYMKFRDTAGNETAVLSQVVTLDTGAPAGPQILINGGALYTTSASVTLSLGAADAAEMAFSNDGFAFSAWEPFAPSIGYSLAGTDGTKIVYVKFRDAALNVSGIVNAGIILDRIAPTGGSIVVASAAPYTRVSQVMLTIGASGANEMQVSENNGFTGAAWEPFATARLWTLSAGDGPKTVYVRFRDTAGHVTGFVSDGITLDTAPPVLVSPAVRINSGAAFANSVTVSVNLQYVDAVSAVVAQDIGLLFPSATPTLPGGGAYSQPVVLTGGEGTRSVYVRFYDAAGNTSVQSASVVLDTTPPALVAVRIDDNATYNKSTLGAATLTITGLDNLSGLSQMRVSNTNGNGNLDGATATGYASPYGWTLATPGSGIEASRVVYVKLIDAAGNASLAASDTINYDTLAPGVTAATVRVDAGAAYARSTSVSLALAPTGSPVEMIIGNDNTFTGRNYEPFAVSRAWTLSSGGDNIPLTVYAKFRDAAGNESSIASDGINVDTVAPSAPTLALDGGLEYALAEPNYTKDTAIEATLSASGWTQADVAEDVSFTSILRTVASATAMPIAVTFTAANSADGLKTVYVRYRDAAGNASNIVSASIMKDGAAPSFGSVVLNAGAAYAQATGLTATLSAQDAGTGLNQVELAQDAAFTVNKVTAAYSPSVNYTLSTSLNGSRTVYARFSDKAGNMSAAVTDAIVLDTVDPAITGVVINSNRLFTTNNIFAVAITSTEANQADMMLSENAAFSGATWQPYQSPTSFPASVINGSKTIYVKLRDASGRISGAGSDSITLDTTPPSNLSLSFPYAVTKSTSNVLTLAASDNISAFANLKVKLTGTSLSTVDGSAGNVNAFIPLTAAKTLVFSTTGTKTVTAIFQDEAGNQTLAVTTTLTIDQTGPGGTVTLLSAQGSNKSASLSWSAMSGAAFYVVEYKADYVSGAFTPSGTQTFTATSGLVTGLLNGKNYGFRVRSYDAVGNADAGYSNILVAGVGTVSRPINQQGQTNRIRSMAIDGNKIYLLGTDTDGLVELFTSIDNGATWNRMLFTGIWVNDNQNALVNAVNGLVHVVVQNISGADGMILFTSSDGGTTFNKFPMATFDGFNYSVPSDIGIAVDGQNVVLSGYDFSSPNYLLKTQVHYAGGTTMYNWSTAVQHLSTATTSILHHALCNAGPHVLLVYQASTTTLGAKFSHDGGYNWSSRTISPGISQSPADMKCAMSNGGDAYVVHTEGFGDLVLHVGRGHEPFTRVPLPRALPTGGTASWKTPQVWTNEHKDIFVSAYDDSSDTLWLLRSSNSYSTWTMLQVDATPSAGLHHVLAGSGYEDVRIAYDINDRETIDLFTPVLPAPARFDVKLGLSTATVSPSWQAPTGIADFSVFSGWSVPPSASETRWSGESLVTSWVYGTNAVASRNADDYGNLSLPYYTYPGYYADTMSDLSQISDVDAFTDSYSGMTYVVGSNVGSGLVSLLRVWDDGTNNGTYQTLATMTTTPNVDVAAYDNEVYVVYCNSASGVYVKKSTNYGNSFGAATQLLNSVGTAALAPCAIDVAHVGTTTYVRVAFRASTSGNSEIQVARSDNGGTSWLTSRFVESQSGPSLTWVDIAIDPIDYTDAAVTGVWADMSDYTTVDSTNNDWSNVYSPYYYGGGYNYAKAEVNDGSLYVLSSDYYGGTYFAHGPLNATNIPSGRIDVNGGQAVMVAKTDRTVDVVYTTNDDTIKYASCLENCSDSAGWTRASVMSGGSYNSIPVAATYADGWGVAVIDDYGSFRMRRDMTQFPYVSSPDIASGGLTGTYYSGTAFTTRSGSRLDSTVNFSWTGIAFGSLSDNFSVAWSGWVYLPAADNYRFQTVVDGGVRVYFNAITYIDQWTPAAATYTSGYTPVMGPGWYPITVVFNDTTGTAAINLLWSRFNGGSPTAFTTIPSSSLGH